ncbi:helix-turn-helix domain-containing protein [Enterococcus sp. LJL128]
MKVGEALSFFRKNMNLTQKSVRPDYMKQPTLSKIENGKQTVPFEEIRDILKKAGIGQEEFFSVVELDEEQNKFRLLFYNCSVNSSDLQSKEKLLSIYYDLNNRSNLNIQEYSNLVSIKIHLGHRFKEVTPLSKKDMHKIYHYLSNKSFFTHFDYVLLSDTIFIFDDTQIDLLSKAAYPIKYCHLRNQKTRLFVLNGVTNIITKYLFERNYLLAERYIDLAKSMDSGVKDYHYHLNIGYLHNMYLYLTTKEYHYQKVARTFVETLQNMGETLWAEQMESEINRLLNSEINEYQTNMIDTTDF